jgi:hypothetical protein
MSDFDQFVRGLGPYAKHYTPEQLHSLHVEVKKMADVLVAAHLAKQKRRKAESSPQADLDATHGDRTLERVITERVDDRQSSPVHTK